MTNPMLKASEQEVVDSYRKGYEGRLLVAYREWQSFSVGDVLIRKKDDEIIEQVSELCPVPRKYKVMYIDNLGMPWVRNINVHGGLGKKFIALASVRALHWVIDPEQLDSLLLEASYDPRREYRQWRTDNPSYGGPHFNG